MERTPLSFLTSAVFDTTANTEAVDVSAFESLIIDFIVGTEVGTSTLDIIIEDSEDGTNWFTHTTLTQIDAAGTVISRIDKFRRYVRLNITIGGTSFVLGITGLGLKRQ